MNNQQLPLVTFEQAKKLKAAGFDWPLHYIYLDYDAGDYKRGTPTFRVMRENFNYYSGHISAPTVALALKWLRDVKGFYFAVMPDPEYKWMYAYADRNNNIYRSKAFKTHDRAECAMLDELLTILENEN